MKVSVIGLGYVGLIQAAGIAKLGTDVIGVEIDKEKVAKVNNRIPPIYEKGLTELIKEVVPSKMTATTDIKKALMESEVTFICVGTPSKKQGNMSLHQLQSFLETAGKVLKNKKYHVFVVKSTVVPGTCEDVVISTLEKSSGKKYPKDFSVVMNPEFLREGEAIEDFFNPDRIILGSTDQKGLKVIKELYASFTCPFLETKFKEAEMIKYASNVSKRLGIDTNMVAKGIGLDKRVSPHFLRSGIGFGGSCFPKDVNAIVYKGTEQGYSPRLLRAVLDINRDQPLKMLELLEKKGPLKGKKIGILGLTFKAGTDDIRESPSLTTIKELLMEEAVLLIYDPEAMQRVKKIFPHLKYMKSGQQVVNGSDIVLILTEWPEFRNLDYKDKLVIDGKNLFYDTKRPQNYEGICW